MNGTPDDEHDEHERGTLFARLPAPSASRPLKEERWTSVRVLRWGEREIVSKVYRTQPWLRWRTLMVPSRAAREWHNLVRVRAAGVPVVEALAWDESRALGCVRASALLTGFVADAPSLKQVLAECREHAARRALCRALGALVRRLHDAGFLGCRITPRNVLVVGAPRRAELLLLDLPAALAFRRGLAQTRRARIDLFDAAMSPGRRQQLSRPERLAVLAGYCAGDRAEARALWRALVARPPSWNRMQKALLVAACSYALPAVRRLLGKERRLSPMRDFQP